MKSTIKTFVKGLAMGAADAVPGVSGGTIAFIFGIYSRLIKALSSINISTIKLFLSGNLAKFWQTVDGTFLLTLFVGMLTSIITLLNIIHWLIIEQPTILWAFFLGLVLTSLIYLSKRINWTKTALFWFLLGANIAISLSLAQSTSLTLTPATSFIAGSIAICAMILPGISGSFILVLLGLYLPISQAVHDFNLTLISSFVLGCFLGLLLFSKFLNWLLNNYHNCTLATMSGFLAGASLKLWPWQNWAEQSHARELKSFVQTEWYFPWQNTSNQLADINVFYSVIAILIGASLILIISQKVHSEKS